MIDERNNLIRVGDALDAITDWLCNEEFRHRIEPNRTVNKFFAKVMLENVPRVADRKDEPTISKMEQIDWKDQMWAEAIEDEPQPFDKPPKCLGCLYSDLDKAFHPCASCVDFGKYIGEVSGKDEPQTMLNDGTLVINVEDATKVSRVLVGDDKNRGDLYYPDDEDEPQKDCKKCKNYDRCKNNRWKCCVYQPKDEPQTDCAWK